LRKLPESGLAHVFVLASQGSMGLDAQEKKKPKDRNQGRIRTASRVAGSESEAPLEGKNTVSRLKKKATGERK